MYTKVRKAPHWTTHVDDGTSGLQTNLNDDTWITTRGLLTHLNDDTMTHVDYGTHLNDDARG